MVPFSKNNKLQRDTEWEVPLAPTDSMYRSGELQMISLALLFHQ